jgi:hypothetical protein
MSEQPTELMKLLWTVASVILGFQITAFIFRLQRETQFRDPKKRHFPVCEYLNLLSIAFLVAGVFVMPLVWHVRDSTAKGMFTAAMCLFAFYPLAAAAHYRFLFRSRATGDSDKVCSPLEGVVFVVALVIAAILGCLTSYQG